jgi:CheY-like chemotaxis protein
MKRSAESEITGRDPAIVLIAESDESARTLYVESVLFFTNYRVVEATHWRDAVERIRRHRPKVAVLTTTLCELDGWAAIRALKHNPATRDVHVIMMAAHEDSRERELAEEAGVDQLIVQPCLPTDLIEQVKRGVAAVASHPRTPAVRRVLSKPSQVREARAAVRESS